jgi:SAM-dependent methyltransferase
MSDKLTRHRDIWKEKKILREIYTGWYKQILKDLNPGREKTLELGAGIGNFKEFKAGVLSSDIEPCPWLDLCFDAHWMPFKAGSVKNIVMVDVLHHLADPVGFFVEAARVLEEGGRIVMIEPFPTLFSLFIYQRFHPEPFLMEANYFAGQGTTASGPSISSAKNRKDPWEANQAAAYLLFFKHKKTFFKQLGSRFKIIKRKKMSCILYPASGGFENRAMIPDVLTPFFKLLEILLVPFRWVLAFRCYIVLERTKGV